jgi:hypothetical protein
MEQHPVPQHISSYQFRLVGDMTVKQFGMLASGCITGLIIYASPLNTVIKWPLIIFSIFLGFALAFLPVQERPLDQWITAFIKAVFSPTQFIWKKKVEKPEIFKTSPRRKLVRRTSTPPPDKEQLSEYLATLPTEARNVLDQQEEDFVKKAVNMFQLTKTPSVTPQPTVTPPWPGVSQPTSPPVFKTQPRHQTKPFEEKPKVKPKMAIPPKRKKVILPEEKPTPKKPAVEAKFSPELPFPEPPSQPNTLVGMVLDKENKIIEGAIIEIRDKKGIPVRALKTNKLGQFRSVTPLDNGEYEMEIEKENYQFDVQKINLTGEIVKPLEIRAKGKINEPAQNT